MEVIIRGEPTQVFVHTVSIIETDDRNMYQFNCIYCGKGIQQFQGQIDKIYPFLEPYDRALVISKCPKCYAKYTFQSRSGKPTPVTKIILHSNPLSITTFSCYLGRQPILEYTAEKVMSLHTRRLHVLPFQLHCTLVDCPVEYFFKEVV